MVVRMLDRIEFAGKEWFIDERLKELRNIQNPHERITFSDISRLTDKLKKVM
jgi:hypothetical protein